MKDILPHQKSIINPFSSFPTNGSRVTTPFSFKRFNNHQFRELKHIHHKLIDKICKEHKYKVSLRATFHEILNVCSKDGMTRAAQETIAKRLGCCVRTVANHIERLCNDGHLLKFKRGWKQTNTMIMSAIQHLFLNKQERISDDLTPPPLKGGREGEKYEKPPAGAPPNGRSSAEEPEQTPEQREKCLSIIKQIKEELLDKLNSYELYHYARS